MAESFVYKGKLQGHSGQVTSLATSLSSNNLLVSGSRDKTLIVWELTREQGNYGYPKKRLRGHQHFVSSVQLSSDGQFALSSSWDKSLRLWEIATGESSKPFQGHKNDVMSVAFSVDNRQIISASRDRSIKLWNILGEEKYNLEGHRDWCSTVCFSPNPSKPIVVSGGWDNVVKVWDMTNCQLVTDLVGHSGYINSVTISPDGSLCASGGKDGTAILWDLNKGKDLYALEAGDEINALIFSPNRYWLCAATPKCIKIWDLQSKQTVAELVPEAKAGHKRPKCISLAFSSDGSTLYSGYTDNAIRVWSIVSS